MDPKPTLDLRRERAKLIGLCTLMLAAGGGLAALAGPPRFPGGMPGANDVLAMLSGSSVPVGPFVVVLVDVAWAMWLWIVGSLCLELALSAVELVARGAEWLRTIRRVADRVSVPLARRAVAAAFAVQIISRGVPIASAQTLTPPDVTLVANVAAPPEASLGVVDDVASAPTYLVRDGDTLWSIAERAYGSGTEYRRVLDANVGRQMSDGWIFSARGVIQPGWQLLVPGARLAIDDPDGQGWYTVRAGDTLRGIAASVLGDSTRWGELFDLNRGATSPDGVHALSDADVIWPGLRLRLPDAAARGDLVAAVPDQAPEREPVHLMAASTSAPVPDDWAARAAAAPATSVGPAEADPPPLLRTPHALDPVVLEPSDLLGTEAEAAAGVSSLESSPSDADTNVSRLPSHADLPTLPLAAGGLGLAAVAGLAFGVRRFRRLRPLPQEPESEVVVEGGFAEAQLAHDLTRGLHGVGFDPLAALVGQLERFLAEYNLMNVGVVAVRHGRSSTTITLRCGLGDQAILVDLAPVFAERLNAEVQAWVSPDQDVQLRLTRLRRTRLLPTADALQDSPCLVPLGVLYDRQVYSAAWNSVGHALVVSLPGHGAETILTGLVATVTARRSPEQLHIWMLASPRALPAPLYELPHLTRLVDPADDSALGTAVEDLRFELDRRAAHPSTHDLLVVVPELTSLGEHAATLALLANHATDLGVRFVAASMDPENALVSPLVSQFGTRLVLRMQAEEVSVALLGVADAAFLGSGGRLLLRLDDREPVELYGYQVAAEHLERLVRVMRSAYPPATRGPSRPADPGPPSQSAPTLVSEPKESTDPPDAMDPSPTVQVDSLASSSRVNDETPVEVQRPPIEVSCFGSPRVSCAGQQVWPSYAGGDAKPWELLLFLACQPSEGISLDDTVEALWPEDELPEDAPHRIRQLRYRLRRALVAVDGAPSTDGICLARGKLRLDPAIVYSDAQEFLSLVRSVRIRPGPDAVERLERARALYTGDVLDGPDARRYAWVSERDESGVRPREHFRRVFQQASLRLAELYADNGALDASAEVYRELTDIEPADERLWLALFRLHAQRGDRRALVREERRLRDSLRELAEDVNAPVAAEAQEPSRETTQEFQRLLASVDERERQPVTA